MRSLRSVGAVSSEAAQAWRAAKPSQEGSSGQVPVLRKERRLRMRDEIVMLSSVAAVDDFKVDEAVEIIGTRRSRSEAEVEMKSIMVPRHKGKVG